MHGSNKEQTLPSMPKLEINEVTNHSEKNVGGNSLKARSLVNGSTKTQNGTNGKIIRSNHDETDDSDSSCDERAARVKKNTNTNANTKNAIQKTTTTSNSTPILLFNGNNKMPTNRLVPYDDSEYDSGTESPPEVKTKAGPFTVTNVATPPVVASFLRNPIERKHSKTPSPARTINGNALSNGAKLLESRRESDSNMVVKTAASAVNSNKRPNEWHGNEVKQKLAKHSHRGYGGAAVSSWNGQRSAMEQEVCRHIII